MRKRQRALALLLTTTMAASLLGGCGSGGGNTSTSAASQPAESQSQQSEPAESQETGGAGADVIAFEDIVFPEVMPANPTLAEEGYYDYDDMSQHYELEFLTHNYGVDVPANDPIKAYLEEKFNVTLTFTTCLETDLETVVSTRFASGDLPDLLRLPSQAYGFTLGEQGLLVDASEMYPYMPQTSKFVTQTLLEWSTMDDGSIPFITKYSVSDSDTWGMAVRQDWLDNMNMKMPETLEELKEYARACTFDDPDGNGKNDTWFMTGAGAGANFQMFSDFAPWFGNQAEHVEDGVLVSPMLDGTTKGLITFMKELYDMGVLAPDWFIIDWENAKSYSLGNRLGLVDYPVSALYKEYATAQNGDFSTAANWTYLPKLPEGTKSNSGGQPGYCWAIPKSAVEGDQGKLMRILHILDSMCYGGDSYFDAAQGGSNEVHEGYDADVRMYLEDGTNYCYVDLSHPGFTQYGTDNLALAPWQTFGYTLKWQMEYCPEDADEDYKLYISKINEGTSALASYDRWPNDALLCTVPGDIAPSLPEYVISQEYKFVVGERSMDEWDDFVQEWLNQGGRDILAAKAEKLGCELPDIAK